MGLTRTALSTVPQFHRSIATVSLAQRLAFAFGFVTVVSTAMPGVLVRSKWRAAESDRFRSQVQGARAGIEVELDAERNAVQDMLRPLCEHDAFVDKALLDLQAGRLDGSRRLALAQMVPDEMKALRLDELVLVTGSGEVLGAGHNPSLAGVKSAEYASQLSSADSAPATVRPPQKRAGQQAPAALMGRCVREGNGVRVGLIGARHLTGLLDRMGKAYNVRLELVSPGEHAQPHADEVGQEVVVDARTGLRLMVARSREPLEKALASLDRTLGMAGGGVFLLSLILAWAVAQSMTKPLSQLAQQVGKVVDSDPEEVVVAGSPEMKRLALAFNKTIRDLTVLRKRQAAVERIAAWREVARRVAHEIKNPLTPIRSSIETLRRLRARDDPKFDEYFDEATRGILEEVHRIAAIASDFARFARLPSPRPAPTDVSDVAKTVVSMHGTAGVAVELQTSPTEPILADRDQLVQMLTNLVQNGMDAARETSASPRVVVRIAPASAGFVELSVSDNGGGLKDEVAARLFEPYVTTKPHGTGLGLPIVQRIVVEHGGEIRYAKGPEGGACFTVLLPAAGPPSTPDSQPHPDERP